MITLLPALTETLVTPLGADTIEQRIAVGIDDLKFVGVVGKRTFSLSPYVIRPPQFQPRVKGIIEESSRGSVIFLKYELYPATKLLILFVSLILLSSAIVAVVVEAHILYPILAIGAIFLIRAVALVNIGLHRDPVRRNLLEVLG